MADKGNALEPCPGSPVIQEVQKIGYGLDELETRIAEVGRRFSFALSAEHPEADETKRPGPDGESELVQTLYHVNERLGYAINSIGRILDRVEL